VLLTTDFVGTQSSLFPCWRLACCRQTSDWSVRGAWHLASGACAARDSVTSRSNSLYLFVISLSVAEIPRASKSRVCVLLLHRCGVNSSSEMINETNTAKGKTAAQREAWGSPPPFPIFVVVVTSHGGVQFRCRKRPRNSFPCWILKVHYKLRSVALSWSIPVHIPFA
jgi:hypothetical protein